MTYRKTHPWLSFRLDPREFPPELWMLLGEAQSKCEHLAGAPLKPAIQERLMRLYLAKGVTATTQIEGNTLTEEQVLKRIEHKLELPKSKEYLGREVDNVIAACNEIGQQLFQSGGASLSFDDVLHYNAAVLDGLSVDEGVEPGRIRRISVGVGRYRGVPWEECEELVRRLIEWMREFDRLPYDAIARGVLKAIMAHLYIAWIHPFGDGNGRTARLVEFRLLLEAGVPTTAAHLLSNHYNQTRTEYIRQLDAASRSGGNVIPFLVYAVQGFVDGLREHIAEVLGYQVNVSWDSYVYERFSGAEKKKIERRRRRLLLELSTVDRAAVDEIRRLTPRLAELYSQKSGRTILRDLQALMEMGLVEKAGEAYRSRKEIILAFLPKRAGAEAAAEQPSGKKRRSKR